MVHSRIINESKQNLGASHSIKTKANLAIEIDGPIHLARKDYDEDRTKFLESSGLKVLRFKNADIESDIESVIEVINRNLINNQPISLPSSRVDAVLTKPPARRDGKGGKNYQREK